VGEGEGELYSRKAARWRDARSGGLNRKRQRTGNDFTPRVFIDKASEDSKQLTIVLPLRSHFFSSQSADGTVVTPW
jgi:hypothetical protein